MYIYLFQYKFSYKFYTKDGKLWAQYGEINGIPQTFTNVQVVKPSYTEQLKFDVAQVSYYIPESKHCHKMSP